MKSLTNIFAAALVILAFITVTVSLVGCDPDRYDGLPAETTSKVCGPSRHEQQTCIVDGIVYTCVVADDDGRHWVCGRGAGIDQAGK